MSMNIIDKTGEPRSDEDLLGAIGAVNSIMVNQPTVLPLFTIHAGTIRDCLLELQAFRRIIAKAKETKK